MKDDAPYGIIYNKNLKIAYKRVLAKEENLIDDGTSTL